MILRQEDVFTLFRNCLGDETKSGISDRTINETIQRFSSMDFGGEELERNFWSAQAELLKTTVRGQISSIVSREAKRIEEEAKRKLEAEIAEAKLKGGEQDENLKSELDKIKEQLSKAGEKEKQELEELKKWKESLEEERRKEEQAKVVAKKKKEVEALCANPSHGMAAKYILLPILSTFNYGDGTLDASVYLESIKTSYNEMSACLSKDGVAPLVSNGGGGSDDDFAEFKKAHKAKLESAKKK